MTVLLRVPRLYPEMEEATVGRWVTNEGAAIAARTPVVEIITDKVSYDVEAPEAEGGEALTLLARCAAEKSVLPVESILAVLGSPGEVLPDWQAENTRTAAARQAALRGEITRPSAATSTPTPVRTVEVGAPAGVIRATPAARRAARAAGVELEQVATIAAGATVTEADVERYLEKEG